MAAQQIPDHQPSDVFEGTTISDPWEPSGYIGYDCFDPDYDGLLDAYEDNACYCRGGSDFSFTDLVNVTLHGGPSTLWDFTQDVGSWTGCTASSASGGVTFSAMAGATALLQSIPTSLNIYNRANGYRYAVVTWTPPAAIPASNPVRFYLGSAGSGLPSKYLESHDAPRVDLGAGEL